MKREKIQAISIMAASALIIGMIQGYNITAYGDTKELSEDTAVSAEINSETSIKINVSEDSSTSSNCINPTFTITNAKDSELNLEDLKIHYYYTEDGDEDETFNCYYAGTIDGNYAALTSYVHGNIVKLDEEQKSENADSCMEITFAGGTLAPGQSMTIQSAVNKSSWGTYDKTNDYSYNNAANICAYLNEELAEGQEPYEEEKKDNNVVISVEPQRFPGIGNECSIPIKLSSIPEGKKIIGYYLKLKYDTDLFEIEDVEPGTDIADKGSFTEYEDNGVIKMLFSADVDESLDAGSNIAVIKLNLHYYLSTIIQFDSMEGSVITDDGEMIDITPDLSESNTINKLNIRSITYDPERIEDESIGLKVSSTTNFESVEGLTEGTDYVINGASLILKKSYLSSLAEDTSLKVTLTDGKTYPLDLILIKPETEEKVKVSTPDISTKGGSTINIPVQLTGRTKDNIVNKCSFSIKYDPEALQDVTINNGALTEFIPEGRLETNVDNYNGIISFNYYCHCGAINLSSDYADNIFANIQAVVNPKYTEDTIKLELAYNSDYVLDGGGDKYKLDTDFGTIGV